jgi:hypothetical protein
MEHSSTYTDAYDTVVSNGDESMQSLNHDAVVTMYTKKSLSYASVYVLLCSIKKIIFWTAR